MNNAVATNTKVQQNQPVGVRLGEIETT